MSIEESSEAKEYRELCEQAQRLRIELKESLEEQKRLINQQ